MIAREELNKGAMVRFWAENGTRFAQVLVSPKSTSKTVQVGPFRYKHGGMSRPRRIKISDIQAVVLPAYPIGDFVHELPWLDRYIALRGTRNPDTVREAHRMQQEAQRARDQGAAAIVGVSRGGVVWVAWNAEDIERMRMRLAKSWEGW